jgi:hypothetical protein
VPNATVVTSTADFPRLPPSLEGHLSTADIAPVTRSHRESAFVPDRPAACSVSTVATAVRSLPRIVTEQAAALRLARGGRGAPQAPSHLRREKEFGTPTEPGAKQPVRERSGGVRLVSDPESLYTEPPESGPQPAIVAISKGLR